MNNWCHNEKILSQIGLRCTDEMCKANHVYKKEIQNNNVMYVLKFILDPKNGQITKPLILEINNTNQKTDDYQEFIDFLKNSEISDLLTIDTYNVIVEIVSNVNHTGAEFIKHTNLIADTLDKKFYVVLRMLTLSRCYTYSWKYSNMNKVNDILSAVINAEHRAKYSNRQAGYSNQQAGYSNQQTNHTNRNPTIDKYQNQRERELENELKQIQDHRRIMRQMHQRNEIQQSIGTDQQREMIMRQQAAHERRQRFEYERQAAHERRQRVEYVQHVENERQQRQLQYE